MSSTVWYDVWNNGRLYIGACFGLFVIALLSSTLVRAANPPNIITYQGKLLESGVSVTTTKAMKFVIYDAATGGTAIYTASGTLPTTSTINVTPISGTFSIDLGDTGTNPIDPDIFSEDELYLEVTIEGTTLTPRKRLSSVPFAVNAARLAGNFATSTPTTTSYIPVADTTGAFTFNTTTVSSLFAGTASFLDGISVVGTSTSTFAGSIDLASGNCFAVNGVCITGGSGSSKWTQGGGLIYPTSSSTDAVIVGGTTLLGNTLQPVLDSLFPFPGFFAAAFGTQKLAVHGALQVEDGVSVLNNTIQALDFSGISTLLVGDSHLLGPSGAGSLLIMGINASSTAEQGIHMGNMSQDIFSVVYDEGDLRVRMVGDGPDRASLLLDGFLNVIGSVTSTFSSSIDLTAGHCFAVDGVCIDGDGPWSVSNSTSSIGIYYSPGNVGIGTSTPSAPLEVWGIGDILVNGIQMGRGNNNLDSNTVVGAFALYTNTIGLSNSAFGYGSLYSNTEGSDNSAFGYDSLYSNTTGGLNSAFGQRSLYSNTYGYYNNAFGSNALSSNTIGSGNNAFGYNALSSSIIGTSNNAFGKEALYSNTLGSANNAFGGESLYYNTTGYSNNAFGYGSLYYNTTGYENNAFGSGSLYYNTTGYNNSAFGQNSLWHNTTGFHNSAFGFGSLFANEDGIGNTAFGAGAIADSQTGSYNVAVGYNVGNGIVTGSNNTILGSRVTGLPSALSNNIIIADGAGIQRIRVLDNGYVGINTTTPGYEFTVEGNSYFSGMLNVGGTSTSTFAGSINLASGNCFAVNGVCITGGSGSSKWTQGVGFLFPSTSTNAVVIGASVTSTDDIFQVIGDMYVSGGITLGGVTRTTWPSDGGGDILFVDGGGYLYSATTSNRLLIGTNTTSAHSEPYISSAQLFVDGNIASDDTIIAHNRLAVQQYEGMLMSADYSGVIIERSSSPLFTNCVYSCDSRYDIRFDPISYTPYGPQELHISVPTGLNSYGFLDGDWYATRTFTVQQNASSLPALTVSASTGRVGINTTTLANAFTVAGSTLVSASSTVLGNLLLGALSESIIKPEFVMDGDDAYFDDDVGIKDNLFVEDTIYVGTSTLQINGDAGNGFIAMTNGPLTISTDEDLIFQGASIDTAVTDKIDLNAGNEIELETLRTLFVSSNFSTTTKVGINTDNPLYELTVATGTTYLSNENLLFNNQAQLSYLGPFGVRSWCYADRCFALEQTTASSSAFGIVWDEVTLRANNTAYVLGNSAININSGGTLDLFASETTTLSTNSSINILADFGAISLQSNNMSLLANTDLELLSLGRLFINSSDPTSIAFNFEITNGNPDSLESYVSFDQFGIAKLTIGDYTLSTTDGDIVFSPSGIDTLTVTANSIGINSSTPNYNLSVSGTANITDDTIIGGDLTVLGYANLSGNAIDPEAIGSYASNTQTDGVKAIEFIDEYMYVGTYRLNTACPVCDVNLLILNISDPSNPTLVTEINNGDLGITLDGGIWKMRYAGDILVLLQSGLQDQQTDTIQLLDVSNPESPVLLSTLVDGVFANMEGLTEARIQGPYLYVTAAQDDRMLVIDISNPRNPILVGTITDAAPNTLLNEVMSLDVKGRYAYTVARKEAAILDATVEDGLTIIDISDPTNPVGVGTLAHGTGGAQLHDPWGIEVIGNYAYVASARGQNIAIIDVSEPSAPVQVGATAVGDASFLNGVLGINISEKYAYTVSQHSGFTITDINDPTNPFVIKNIPAGNSPLIQSALDMALNGGYAYIASFGQDTGSWNVNGSGGIQVFDIRSVTIANTSVGAARIGRLDVDTRARFNNQVEIAGGLTIGRNGLLVRGDTSFGSAVSNDNDSATTTLNFANTSLFKSSVSASDTYAYVFDTQATIGSSSRLLSIQNNSTAYFDIFGNGTMLLDGNAYFGTNAASETLTNAQFVLDGDDVFVADDLGVKNRIYVEDGIVFGGTTNTTSIYAAGGNLLVEGPGSLILATGLWAGNGFLSSATSTFLAPTYFGALVESMSHFAFSMTSGSVYIEDALGVNGDIYTDGSLFIGGATAEIFSSSSLLNLYSYHGVDIESEGGGVSIRGNNVIEMTIIPDGSPGDTSNARFYLGVGTPRALFLEGTSVGIGHSSDTDEPGQELDVEGQIQFNISATAGTTIGVCKNVSDGIFSNVEFRECDGTAGDIAEYYETRIGVEPGDIVMTTGDVFTYTEQLNDPLTGLPIYKPNATLNEEGEYNKEDVLTKESRIAILEKAMRNNTAVIGIVATNPYQVLGRKAVEFAENPQPIAIAGRVPTKVTTDNGPIAVGDAITLSSIPGVGMKAVTSSVTVGIALEPYSGDGIGKVMVAVTPGQYGLIQQLAALEKQINEVYGTLGMTNPEDMTVDYDTTSGALSYTGGNLLLQGNSILGVRAIVGFDGKWRISQDGLLISTIETSQGNKDLYALQSEQAEIVLSGNGQLEEGIAEVLFDPIYDEIIDAEQPIKISVTLTDEANGVYVTDKSTSGFTVKELAGGTSDATFDWVAIVYRKDSITGADIPAIPEPGDESSESNGQDTSSSDTPSSTPPTETIEEYTTSTPDATDEPDLPEVSPPAGTSTEPMAVDPPDAPPTELASDPTPPVEESNPPPAPAPSLDPSPASASEPPSAEISSPSDSE